MVLIDRGKKTVMRKSSEMRFIQRWGNLNFKKKGRLGAGSSLARRAVVLPSSLRLQTQISIDSLSTTVIGPSAMVFSPRRWLWHGRREGGRHRVVFDDTRIIGIPIGLIITRRKTLIHFFKPGRGGSPDEDLPTRCKCSHALHG